MFDAIVTKQSFGDGRFAGFDAPVAVAIECVGQGVPRASGLPDDLFAHDGQITKRPIRALTLSALAPRGGEVTDEGMIGEVALLDKIARYL